MSTFLAAATFGVGAVNAPAASAASDLVVNGSFEEPDIVLGSFGIFPVIPGWSSLPRDGATSSGIEIQDHVAGDPAAGAGGQFAELDSDGPTLVFQDVATVAGSTYALSFIYSARPGTATEDNHFLVSAGADSAEIGPLTSAEETDWRRFTLVFTATASITRIAFLDLGPEQTFGGLGAYIDSVSVSSTNSAPDCSSVAVDTPSLWPPNSKLTAVTLAGAVDPDGDELSLTISGVTQDEPVDGSGDGSGAPDAAAASSSDQVLLRAERSGLGDGRVYLLAFAVDDGNGGSCGGALSVAVPHDRRGAPAVDSGQVFDSFGS